MGLRSKTTMGSNIGERPFHLRSRCFAVHGQKGSHDRYWPLASCFFLVAKALATMIDPLFFLPGSADVGRG